MSLEIQANASPAGESASGSTAISAVRPAKFTFDQRFVAPLFITLILVVGQTTFGVLESFPKTLLAICTSIVTEIVLGKLLTGKIPHLASAYISGISVGILIRSPEFWPYALCAMISITSKYVIRVNGRHIWNPSNFGISVMLLIAASSVATLSIQWGNDLRAITVIWFLGSLIIYRLKRFHICAVYVVSFLAYAALRSALPGYNWWTEVAPLTSPMYQLFIFFMITDPKTTVRSKKGQMLTVFLIATMECCLRLTGTFFAIHAPYYSLFLVGPAMNLIEMWQTRNAIGTKPKPSVAAA